MANLSYTNTLAPNTTADANAVMQNFNDAKTWLNNRDNASDTWQNVKISATTSNPLDVASSASSTEVSINNTATTGNPILTFKLSGSQTFTLGIDDSDSQAFKLGTTSLTTNNAMRIPTTGSQVQFSTGLVGTPCISFAGRTTDGLFSGGSGRVDIVSGGVNTVTFNASAINTTLQYQSPDGTAGSPSISFSNFTTKGMWAATGKLAFSTGGSERLRIDDNGNIVNTIGALATNATNGFIYIETCAGTPTGTPTTITGSAPMIYDTTGHKFWIYDSGWKGVAIS